MDALVQTLLKSRKTPISKTNTIKEFKMIFKYLAFVACAAKAPIRQKMLGEALTRIAKAGDAENIKRWDVVDKCIKDWIVKMEALIKMWTDQAGE